MHRIAIKVSIDFATGRFMSTLERAIETATQAHKGQFDKSGNDYIGHPLRVMKLGKSEEEQIVGVLHDVVEDTEWTFEALSEEGFSKEIIDALRCVTKLSENENYDDFIVPYLSDKDVKRLKKYLKAYKRLIGEPTYSVYACRQEHPNAFDPWTEEADAELTKMWEKGTSIDTIAEHFGRKPSAIMVRMRKLGL